jgi:hypothetical protein
MPIAPHISKLGMYVIEKKSAIGLFVRALSVLPVFLSEFYGVLTLLKHVLSKTPGFVTWKKLV